MQVVEVASPEDQGSYLMDVPELRCSPQGLHAITFHEIIDANYGMRDGYTRMHLLPAKEIHTQYSSVRDFGVAKAFDGAVAWYPTLESSLLLASSSSGLYSVIVSVVEQDSSPHAYDIRLLHYNTDPPDIQLNIDDLRRIAQLTYRVERNWNEESPRIIGAVRSIPYILSSAETPVEPAAILAVIPATSLVLLYTPKTAKQIILCDSDGEIPLSSLHVGKIRQRAHFDELGRHLIAVAIESKADPKSVSELRIFSIEYGAGKLPAIRQIFSLPQTPLEPRAIFLCKDSVGIIPDTEDDSKSFSSIHVIDLTKNLSVDIHMPLGNFPNCADNSSIDPRLESLVQVVELKAGYGEVWRASDAPELETAPQGLHMFHLERGLDVWTQACMWPVQDMTTTLYPSPPMYDTKVSGYLHGGTAMYGGSVLSGPLVASSLSGIYSIIVVYTGAYLPAPVIYLLQYETGSSEIQHCGLALPYDSDIRVNLEEIYDLAIDERSGVIYLSHVEGHLLTLPYA
ncbi:hypothetical protein D9615_008868 [Tricholomella constricta]|uniref:Uncharacterized protein n=1 Tax=Tricholomella constricta TaxID=117010 RepID=A0A8H5GZX3_9AGAR|nr:hypothetical protein D9615_008868 [Tricholomella constricta]